MQRAILSRYYWAVGLALILGAVALSSAQAIGLVTVAVVVLGSALIIGGLEVVQKPLERRSQRALIRARQALPEQTINVLRALVATANPGVYIRLKDIVQMQPQLGSEQVRAALDDLKRLKLIDQREHRPQGVPAYLFCALTPDTRDWLANELERRDQGLILTMTTPGPRSRQSALAG